MPTPQSEEQKRKAKEYEAYVKKKTPTHSLLLNMAGAFIMGGLICVAGTGDFKYLQKHGDEPGNKRCMDFAAFGTGQCPAYRIRHISQAGKMGWSRNFSAHYRICKFRSSSGY